MANKEAAVAAQTQAAIAEFQPFGNEISATAAKSPDFWQRTDEQNRAVFDIRKVTEAIQASGDASHVTRTKLVQLEADEMHLESSTTS